MTAHAGAVTRRQGGVHVHGRGAIAARHVAEEREHLHRAVHRELAVGPGRLIVGGEARLAEGADGPHLRHRHAVTVGDLRDLRQQIAAVREARDHPATARILP